jgi:hypothetical protein
MLLFDDDLGKRNRIDAQFLNALAIGGLGEVATAIVLLKQVLEADPNHLIAAEILGSLEHPDNAPGNRTKECAAL